MAEVNERILKAGTTIVSIRTFTHMRETALKIQTPYGLQDVKLTPRRARRIAAALLKWAEAPR